MMFFGGRWNFSLHSSPLLGVGMESGLVVTHSPFNCSCFVTLPALATPSLFVGYLRGVKGGVAGGVVTADEAR